VADVLAARDLAQRVAGAAAPGSTSKGTATVSVMVGSQAGPIRTRAPRSTFAHFGALSSFKLPKLKTHLSGWAGLAEFGSTDVAAHRGEAAMPRVAHDFLVGDAVAVGGCNEAGTEAVRAYRLR
jgi:hypothetical protein